MIYVIIWWFVVQFLGWLALPAAFRIFRWLPDRGYAFSKALGLLMVSYLLWLGVMTGFLHNSRGGILFAILLTAAISAWLYFRYRAPESDAERPSLLDFLRQHKAMVISVEVLFTLAFILWAVLRAYASFKIDTAGGEKFMEIAFLNAILRSPSFPPLDPWLSGFSISYYYFGYVMIAVMTRLTTVPAGVAFDLYDALLFALTLVGAFGVVYNLIPTASSVITTSRKAIAGRGIRTGRLAFGSGRFGQPIRYALLGALLVGVMGNLSGFFESMYSTGQFSEGFWNWLNVPKLVASGTKTGTLIPKDTGWFWWWRGSRVVVDRDLLGNATNENITEFPFFSFLLGDNHPHVLALPFVLLATGLALNLLRRTVILKSTRQESKSTQGEVESAPGESSEVQEEVKGGKSPPWWNPVAECLDGDWVLFVATAFCLGALGFLNTWDLPMQLVLTTLAFGVGLYAVQPAGNRRVDRVLLRRTFTLGIGLGLAGVLPYLLHYLGFRSQASGILPYVFPPTQLRQYFNMFGPFLVILTLFLAVYLVRSARRAGYQVLVKALLGWLITALGLLGMYALILLGLALLDPVLHLTDNPAFTAALSGLGAFAVLGKALLSRLKEPWLLIWLSSLITFAVANIYWHVRLAAGGEGSEGEVGEIVDILTEGQMPSAPTRGLREAASGQGNPASTRGLQDAASGQGNPAHTRGLRDASRRQEVHVSTGRSRAVSTLRPPISPSVLFTFLLVFLGVALTFSVEFVYLRDNFGTRMNTIFKFYYQAWVMMACASAYGVWWMLNRSDKVIGKVGKYIFSILAAIMILAGMFYPVLAFDNRVEGFKGVMKPTLDGTAVLAQRSPDDWAAIQWLNQNVTGVAVILEAPGYSYNYEGRISALTGLPAVLGWALHEDQWRGDFTEQGKRQPDIATIYTSRDDQETLSLLRKWNVKYVILGETELSYIRGLCSQPDYSCSAATAADKFNGLMTPVFTGGTMIYAMP